MHQLTSLASALWVALNLLTGLVFLLPVALVNRLLPMDSVQRACALATDHIYRTAVRVNSFWMKRVVGIELVVKGNASIPANAVILCNHQSWFDIPIIQDIVSSKGPNVRFLIKRELIWVPIIGWICLALDLPRLGRSKKSNTRKADVAIIEQASMSHGNNLGALLIFPEGTRFTEAKRVAQSSPYDRLLRPKAGGLRTIGQYLGPDDEIVDITIDYHKRNVRIWECLHGDPQRISVTIEHFRFSEIDDPRCWINERWKQKDRMLAPLQQA